jgi:hypothetical protein
MHAPLVAFHRLRFLAACSLCVCVDPSTIHGGDVVRVHLTMAHAAMPELLPTPPMEWKMLPLILTPPAPLRS